MSFYTRVIFPRLCDFLLGRPFVARHRRELLAQAAGDVLEVGFGTGLNLAQYPEHVHKITAIEPGLGMQRRARRRIEQGRVAVDLHAGTAESLPFAAATFDCVVSTFTLCSIDNVERAVGEIYRVLRPAGRFLFLEHGLSPDPGVQKWQRRLNRLEMWCADGCRLDRPMKSIVAGQPFAALQVEEFDLEKTPRTHGHIYRGSLTR